MCCIWPGLLADLHVYNPSTRAWTDLSVATAGAPPAARLGHGFAAAGGKLYVHGGWNGSGEGDGCAGKP